MAIPYGDTKIPDGIPLGAGYVGGVPRLSVLALTEADASLGVAYVGGLRKDGATALPSGLAMGATWDPALPRQAGATIAGEAHSLPCGEDVRAVVRRIGEYHRLP